MKVMMLSSRMSFYFIVLLPWLAGIVWCEEDFDEGIGRNRKSEESHFFATSSPSPFGTKEDSDVVSDKLRTSFEFLHEYSVPASSGLTKAEQQKTPALHVHSVAGDSSETLSPSPSVERTNASSLSAQPSAKKSEVDFNLLSDSERTFLSFTGVHSQTVLTLAVSTRIPRHTKILPESYATSLSSTFKKVPRLHLSSSQLISLVPPEDNSQWMTTSVISPYLSSSDELNDYIETLIAEEETEYIYHSLRPDLESIRARFDSFYESPLSEMSTILSSVTDTKSAKAVYLSVDSVAVFLKPVLDSSFVEFRFTSVSSELSSQIARTASSAAVFTEQHGTRFRSDRDSEKLDTSLGEEENIFAPSSRESQPIPHPLNSELDETHASIMKRSDSKDHLIVVTPTQPPHRTYKEVVLPTSAVDLSYLPPAISDENVAEVVSMLTEDNPRTSDEDNSSKESVFQSNITQNSSLKNKTSRDDNPHLDEIISGIIHLLAGDVQVVRPPPNFHIAHSPVQRPTRLTSTRVNDRGPNKFSSHSRTVIVFSQPPHHMAVPPMPHPPVRIRPSSTRRPVYPAAPDVSHILGLAPARPDKITITTTAAHTYKPLLNPSEEILEHTTTKTNAYTSSLRSSISSAHEMKTSSATAQLPQRKSTERDDDKTLLEVELTRLRVSSSVSTSDLDRSPSSSSTPFPANLDTSKYSVHPEESSDESEEISIVETLIGSSSQTFEIFQDPPADDAQSEENKSKDSTQLYSSQGVASGSEILKTAEDSGDTDTNRYLATEALPIDSKIPSGPITDWVPVFERPTLKFRPDFKKQGATSSGTARPDHDVVIITQPTVFDLTVTNAIAGVHATTMPQKSSIVSRSREPLRTTYPSVVVETMEDSERFSTRSSSRSQSAFSATELGQKTTSSTGFPTTIPVLAPSQPEIIYGRPSLPEEQPILPPKVDNMSKEQTNTSSTITPTGLPRRTGTFSATEVAPDEGIMTVLGKGTVNPHINPTTTRKSATVSSSSSHHPHRPSSGGSPLGRPIVIPVDIEEVRPFVGAINPPRQGSRPSSNGGQRPPPGFSGPPSGVGNVQVAQAGVNVAEDPRRPSGARPPHLQTSRPPLIRTPPRPRPNTPLVRIDTCIVGDDSTCELQMNETCKTEHGVSSCQCRAGFARSFARGPCQPVVSVMLSLKVDRLGDQRILFSPRYQDPNSEEYRLMEFEAKQALSSLFSYTAFSRNFLGVSVNKFYSIGGKLVINATVNLEEKESTRAQSLRLQMRQEVTQAINSRNHNIGESRLYVEGPFNLVPAVEDLNECSDKDLNDCSDNGMCQNIFGTFLCKCKSGYMDPHPHEERKSGRTCSVCSPDYCSNHGQCYIEHGQRQCKCRGNYIGSRCEIDSEVLGVALGASLAAVIIIILTLACLCIWNRRWKREQQKTEVMSARSANSGQTFSYLNKVNNANTYRLTLEDRMRWAHIADVVGNVYVQPEPGAAQVHNAVVSANQNVFPGTSRCHTPTGDEASWYNYNTRPRSRNNSHAPSQGNGSFYDMDFSTRETYVGPSYAPSSRYMTPNVMRPYYS